MLIFSFSVFLDNRRQHFLGGFFILIVTFGLWPLQHSAPAAAVVVVRDEVVGEDEEEMTMYRKATCKCRNLVLQIWEPALTQVSTCEGESHASNEMHI